MDQPSPADGDDTRRSAARRSRRRSRQAADALIVDTPQAALPAPASAPAVLSEPEPNEAPNIPAPRSTRRRRLPEATASAAGKIHLKSEAIDAQDQEPDAGAEKEKPAADSIAERFRRETSHYATYAYRLVFSRLVLVIAILCFVWALWQAFQAVVNSYYLTLSLPQPEGVSLTLTAWAALDIANLAPPHPIWTIL